MEHNVLESLSKLTTIPKDTFTSLSNKAVWCICDSVQDSDLNGDYLSKIYIGIGYLIIANEEEQIKFKFIPSEYLESSVKETLLEGKNPLQFNLERNLVNKILKTYKDII